jgi:hypothetical protein
MVSGKQNNEVRRSYTRAVINLWPEKTILATLKSNLCSQYKSKQTTKKKRKINMERSLGTVFKQFSITGMV